jgi:hypothetical protein
MGTLFSSMMMPPHSAESAAEIIGALIPQRETKSAAMQAAERMLYRGTAGDCCAAFFKAGSFPATILAQDQEDFLRGGFRAVFDFGFRCGFDGSEIQPGGSLAGKDSSEASSTGSRSCETSARSCGSRSSGLALKVSRFSAGLAIAIHFTAAA